MNRKVSMIAIALVILFAGIAGAAQVKKYFDPNQPYFYSPNPSKQKVVASSATLLATDNMIICDSTNGDVNLTLPTMVASSIPTGKQYIIKKLVAANKCYVTAATTDSVTNTINGAAARYLSSAISSVMSFNANIQTGDWKVFWETNPVQVDMSTGVITIGSTTTAF